MPQSKPILLLTLLAYAVAMRLLPYGLSNCDIEYDRTIIFYPWNFSPLTAICLMSGVCFVDRRLAMLLPLGALLLSNIGIGVLSGHWDWAFPADTWWLPNVSYSAAAGMGTWLRCCKPRDLLLRGVCLGLGFEIFFFLVSNILCVYGTAPIYPRTIAGVLECYTAALPFFRNASVSTLAYVVLIFGPWGVYASMNCEHSLGELAAEPVQ